MMIQRKAMRGALIAGMVVSALTGLVGAAPVAAPARAQSAGSDDHASFRAYLDGVWPRAAAAGVSRGSYEAIVAGLTPNPRVIALDRDNLSGGGTASQPIPPFAPYRARHVDAARIGGGRATYARLRPQLLRHEAATGVPESIMVAIYGHETNYGRVVGDFDLPRSLATLAWEGRRRALFEGELIATMKMLDRGVPRSALTGSWAGAFGYPQFLPSVYLQVARDGDGDGASRIWSSEADALASIAAYFEAAGWRPGEPWGVAARVPDGFVADSMASSLNSPRCNRVFGRHSRWRSIAEWRALGVVPQAPIGAEVQATLIEPDGRGRTAYLLTGNYRVILDYNCSNFYALSVGLLADEIAR